MAQKSKTQRAKASANRAAKKAAKQEAELNGTTEVVAAPEPAESKKKSLFSKKSESTAASEKKIEKKTEKAPKKKRFQFLREVRSELKRVTWPTRQDVLRWSLVVVAALLFFGIYTAVLDNGIITPVLIAFSGLGA